MKPVIDLTKEYGLVLEGGGAKGAYQIGAWKAMREAGVKIKGIAGTSVGALNGALICMDDLTNAEKVWENISYSSIMSVEDEKMELLFHQKKLDVDMLKSAFDFMKEGGIDVTPLKELIAECIDEEKIIHSPVDLYVLTFNVDDKKELDIDVKQCDPELIKDFLLASAYIFPLFKNERLHGKRYIDGHQQCTLKFPGGPWIRKYYYGKDFRNRTGEEGKDSRRNHNLYSGSQSEPGKHHRF